MHSISMVAQHPCLSLTETGVQKIRAGVDDAPLFKEVLSQTRIEVDAILAEGAVDVPVPKDMAGGYTHEQHKRNYKALYKAGNLYQITGESKYAEFVKQTLLTYAALYPTLDRHPTMKSYATGKIFWQCLNDANWLVFASQAYDCVYDYLSKKEIQLLEKQLFVPFANFLSEENPRFFNRIHNHSTWANAAVGMIAIVMKNDTLLNKALYGLDNDGLSTDMVDNDGGFIKKDGQDAAGFLAQLDYSFSPDGYFAEGPYYLRYAIFPFLKFGQALHINKSELDIFNYRDGILKKATNVCLQLTDSQGRFFPINDSQKGMTYEAYELVTAVDLMYYIDRSNTQLLNWASLQGTVSLDEFGYETAAALKDWKAEAPMKKSVLYSDGVSGKEGGIAAMRTKNAELFFKYSTQGMGHGHFDRLSYSLYDNGGEVIQDYGAVRWVNVDQKGGGRYLPENKTFAKQSIGHNTVVVNNTSHYKGSVKRAEKAHPTFYAADFNSEEMQMVSAIENNAYDDVKLHRTLFFVDQEDFTSPFVIDLIKIRAKDNINIDVPTWYLGDFMKGNFNCSKSLSSLTTLGEKNGYQHIWKEASCSAEEETLQFNWFRHNRFYTLHSVSKANDEYIMGRLGANDPNFNLRPDPVLIQRRSGVKDEVLFNIIELHGSYDRATEIPDKPYAAISDLSLIYSNDAYIIVAFKSEGQAWKLYLSLDDNNVGKSHRVEHNGNIFEWKGIYKLTHK